MKRRYWLAIIGGVLAVVVVAVVAFHDAVIGTAVKTGAASAGYAVGYDRLHVGASETDIAGLTVRSLKNEPILDAQHVRVDYSLPDLVRRAQNRLFGLVSVEIDHPHLVLVHHPDGTWNFPLPSSQGNSNKSTLTIPTLKLRLIDGTATLTDPGRRYPLSRHLGVDDLNIAADLTPSEVATWSMHMALLESNGRYRVEGKGRLDPQRGYEINRVTAAELPIGPLVNYALDTASVNVANGVLHHVDVCYCAMLGKDGVMGRHLSVAARVQDLMLYLGGLAKPVRDGSGPVFAYDDGLTIPKLNADIAGIPVRVSGGIVAFSKPQFRLRIAGRGSLDQLTSIAGQSAEKLRLSGPLDFGLLVEGDATSPLLFAGFTSPSIGYAGYALNRPSGLVALDGTDATIIAARLQALGVGVGTHGMLSLGKKTSLEVAASAGGNTGGLPYASLALPGLGFRAESVFSGPADALSGSGEIDGASAQQHLATAFALDGSGTGSVGPLELTGPNGESLLADIDLDRPHNAYSGLIDAHALALSNARLAGAAAVSPALRNLPPFDASLDARLAIVSDGKHGYAAGDLDVPSAHLRGRSVGRLQSRLGADQSGAITMEGDYRGDLSSLAAAAGASVPATGGVDLPFAVAYGGGSALAQIRDARFEGARLDGVQLEALSGSVGLRGKNLQTVDVYGLRADLGNGSIAANGSFGNGGVLHVTTSQLDLRPIAAAFHAPLTTAELSAFADVSGTPSQPDVRGGVVLSHAHVVTAGVGLDVGASAGLALAGDHLDVRNGDVVAGPAVGTVDLGVDGVRSHPSSATYRVDAHVRDADIATLAQLARAHLPYPEGTLDADVNVAGSGSHPSVDGSVKVPEGSINGLAFRNAAVGLNGNASSIRVRGGTVTVGTSTLGFDGDVASSAQRLALRAPRVDLSDFNDYFDAGDTLGGKGSLAIALARSGTAISTTGGVNLADVRYRQLPLGDTTANWSTSGRAIRLNAGIGGAHGRASAHGTVTLAAGDPTRDALHRTTLDLAANLAHLDLGTWLPLVGVKAPVEGYVDANAAVRGRYPGLAVATNASMTRGIVGRIPVTRAEITASAANGRATIANAVFEIPNLTVTASGFTGLEPSAAVALDVRAQSDDIGALAKTATGQPAQYHGALAADLSARGRVAKPDLGATLDLTQLAYQNITVPRVHAEAALVRDARPETGTVQVKTAEIDFDKGKIVANGSAPVRLQPNFGMRQRRPVALNVAVQQVDLGQFGKALPKGTTLTGTLDGNVALGGTLKVPSINGQIALSNGSFVGPQEKRPITGLGAILAFSGTTADLRDLKANIGGGTLDGSAHASVPDLRDPGHDLTYNGNVNFNHVALDAPQYYSGRLDGNLSIARAALDTEPTLGGTLLAQNARIPLTAIFNPNAPAPTSSAAPLALALDLDVKAVHDVRVQSGQVDIGALGEVHAGGTVSKPTLQGEFDSTDGTVSFYRTFRLQSGTVAFAADNGAVPTIDASATTTLTNPETFVTLGVTGLATQLNVNLQSDPSYSREQILGLLLGLNAFGAVNGVAAGGAPAPAGNPLAGVAQGQLGTLLTRNVLEPLGANLGGAVGLQSLAINYDPFGGGLDVGAQKKIFKNVSAVFAESFNYPSRSSLGLLAKPNDRTAVQVTFFTQQGTGNFTNAPNSLNSTSQSVTASQPANGTSGLSFSFQKKY